MSQRIAVIGLDGMSWSILTQLIDHGVMPNLERMLTNALKGKMHSIIPPVTPPSWTSLASGVNPGKHGIFDFTHFNNTKSPRILNSKDVHYPRIHEMVALEGKKSIIINQPLTYPIVKLQNTMVITDWLAPKLIVYPQRIKSYVPEYPSYDFIFQKKTILIQTIKQEITDRVKSITRLIKRVDWDLLWVVLTEPDAIFHHFYSDLVKRTELLSVFKTIDSLINETANVTDTLFLISDHGFTEFTSTFNVNRFLLELGLVKTTKKNYLQRKLNPHNHVEYHQQNIQVPFFLVRNLMKITPMKKIIRKLYRHFLQSDIGLQLPHVDPQKSKAFMPSFASYGIKINDPACEERLINELAKLDFIKKVVKREELYNGPYVNKAPELILLFDKNKKCYVGSIRIHPEVVSQTKIFGHHPDSIFIIHNKQYRQRWIDHVSPYDVVPTILALMNLPLPLHSDGIPLKSAISQKKRISTMKQINYQRKWNLVKNIWKIRSQLL